MEEDDIFGVYWRHFDIAKTDKLYWILGSFHVSHFGLLLFSLKRENLQIFMFLSLGIMMFFAEKINEYLAAQKWLSTQNYFDSSGMFFTCAVAIPVIINLIIMVFIWIRNSANTLVLLKRRQLKEKFKAEKSEGAKKTE